MNKGKRKIFYFIISIELVALIYIYQYPITNKIFNETKASNYYITNNDYAKYFENNNISLTNDFNVKSKEQLYNVLLTIINSGEEESKFYCNYNYTNCIDSIKNFNGKDIFIEEINNIVHPYNNFNNITFKVEQYGVVNVKISKLYSDEDIELLNNEIDRIYNSIINENMDIKTKILTFHDYIVNNSKYDKENANLDYVSNNYGISKANNIVFNHIGLCGSYTDTMAIFLNKIGVENYKISSDNHIWNYIKLDDYYHLDVTWDDPYTDSGRDILSHEFFLITTEKLHKLDKESHNYNESLYKK